VQSVKLDLSQPHQEDK